MADNITPRNLSEKLDFDFEEEFGPDRPPLLRKSTLNQGSQSQRSMVTPT